MSLRDKYMLKLFDRIPFLYNIYDKLGLKDINNGTYELKRRLKNDNNIVAFDHFKMILDEDSYMDLSLYREFVERGLYETQITKYIVDNLHRGGTFVDIGANSGYFSLLASKLVGDGGSVFSFEPFPDTFHRLERNIRLNEANNVILFRTALSSCDGKAKLHVSRSSDGLNSLKYIPLTKESVEVYVQKLDNVCNEKSVDMIKIDAEGSELDIIQGATLTLMKNKDLKIIYEVNRTFLHTPDIINALNEAGFSSFIIADNGKISKKISSLEEIPRGVDNLVALRK